MANEYINKVVANNNTLIDLTSDTAEASDVLEGKTMHLASGAPAVGTYRPSDEIVARLEATVGHSGKNLMKLSSLNTDYVATISVDESTSSLAFTSKTGKWLGIPIYDTDLGVQRYGKTYVITCVNNLASTTSGRITIRRSDTNSIITSVWFNTTGNKTLTFTPNAETFPNGWYISILATGGTSEAGSIDISNLMLREAVIEDDTFEPYIEPTDNQIETKTRAYLTSTVGHVGKNQLSFGSQNLTKVIAGVTFTVDPSTGTVTANGTSTSSSGSQYNIRITGNQVPAAVSNYSSRSIPNGKYYFCGCPSGGTTSGTQTYNVYIYDHTAGARAKRWNGSTNVDTDIGVTTKNELLINDQSHTLSYNIRVFDTNGQNKVFRPMIWSGDIEDDTFEPYCIPIDTLMARLDDRISALEIASNRIPEPEAGRYYITVFNNTGTDLLNLMLTTPQNDGGEFIFSGLSNIKTVHKDMLYFGSVFGVLFEAGTGDTVMSITNAGTWNHDFDVDGFLNMRDVKDGSATNFISIHLCADGQIRNKSEYEIYMGI